MGINLSKYKCLSCGRKFNELPGGKFRCPYCGYRIIMKCRPEVVRVVRDVKIPVGKMPF